MIRMRLLIGLLFLLVYSVTPLFGQSACELCRGTHNLQTGAFTVYCGTPDNNSWGTEDCTVTVQGNTTTCSGGSNSCYYIEISPPPGGGDDQGDGTDCSDPNRVGCGSPILIDLGHQSYKLTGTSDGVSFDLRNEGVPRRVAWTRAGVDNAFLALDRNGNGRIDNGSELFGNYTPLRSGRMAQHGFEALNELDGNRDGVVDGADSAWSELLLWTDRNHDGLSTSDELAPIAGSVVTALETASHYIGRKDQWGNAFRYMAHARFAQGRRAYYDVYLKLTP